MKERFGWTDHFEWRVPRRNEEVAIVQPPAGWPLLAGRAAITGAHIYQMIHTRLGVVERTGPEGITVLTANGTVTVGRGPRGWV